MKNIAVPDIWNADIYSRLSKEDRRKDGKAKDESNSIKNQRDLLLDFVSRNPDIRVAHILADDGATGADFDREDFKTMIAHIESGEVNCVIVKDFSRLGRDHIETGKYIERYFTSKGVRFISVNDNYDSLISDMSDGSNGLIVPFKNIINEAFIEDISEKTKAAIKIKRKNGELVCNYAVYGYLKSSEKTLVPDDYAADVVRAIFEDKIRGYSENRTAERLNAAGVLSPAEYKKSLGMKYYTPFAMREQSLWTANAVKRILTNRVYIGALEQGKRTKASYRVKKVFYKPREAWSVHENNHEAIVSVRDFELVRDLMAKDTRTPPGAEIPHLFSGFVVCGNCGMPMIVKTTVKKSGKSYVNYICSTHKKYGTCRNNNISGLAVERYALTSVQRQIAGLIDATDIESGGMETMQSRKRLAVEGMIDKALQSVREYQDYTVKSYEHFVDGVIDETEYKMFKDGFKRQIETAERNISGLRRDLEYIDDDARSRSMIEHFKAHENLTALDRRAVACLIDSVIVCDSKHVEIRLRYLCDFDTPPEFAEQECLVPALERAVI
ncbi:MAG: recombinase family protein [Clostridiales Family XIII bacterium]|jgi:DNA invertase Pin-like site-specific DNA recombinase|nr:recombinase family protein [Clostridiales Family XIII bacterium]